MSEPAISLVFTSRGRPQDLIETLTGLWGLADHPELLEAIVAVDPDDEATLAAERKLEWAVPRARLWVAPERYGYRNLHLYLNQLAVRARGTWCMWWNDDMRMQTQGWDTIIRLSPQGVLWPSANHVQHANIVPVWPRAWSDAAGMVCPTMHMDTWLQYAGEQLGRHFQIPVEVVHHRADVTGEHDDQTYAEGRKLMGSEGMHPGFQDSLRLLPGWIEAVRQVMT
jgi:pimeloyl-ACP methyl ester carboxylesterase